MEESTSIQPALELVLRVSMKKKEFRLKRELRLICNRYNLNQSEATAARTKATDIEMLFKPRHRRNYRETFNR